MPATTRFHGTLSRLARVVAIVGVVLVAFTLRAHADASVLHEFLPPDPNEDVTFSATTIEGDLPAAIRTQSGMATVPDPRRPPVADHAYGGMTTDDGPDSTYEPDRDTRRPSVESYDEPFSPATAPFKRLRAYDEVTGDYALHVHDQTLRIVPVGGALNPGDEPFYGDISVDLVPDVPVRIPTVGPGSRLLRVHANPEVPLDVLRDGADNWFVKAQSGVRIRLVMELAIPRATFGSEFADVDWAGLHAHRHYPPGHKGAYREVARRIGVKHNNRMRPKEAVKKLVAYFRSFSPSDDFPKGRNDIFLDLALSKKGVCRHRAFGFLVMGLGLGIPTRMVVNEAHAWVEVYDGTIWHRVDLGGAAANFDYQRDPSKPRYMPPPDPFGWPNDDDSGEAAIDRADEANAQAPAPTPPVPTDAPAPSATPVETPAEPSQPSEPQIPASEVTVTDIDKDVRRGTPFHLRGKVASEGASCPHVRVDVVLTSPTLGQVASIGALSTDDQGAFDGAVVVPRDFALGDYDLAVATPGDARCGPSPK